jgi:hypothetical protein
MTSLLELADRCEDATGPDGSLDKEIAKARYGDGIRPPKVAFTASLDAAMALVPESIELTLDISKPRSTAQLFGSDPLSSATGATPALALCAAALRARAA